MSLIIDTLPNNLPLPQTKENQIIRCVSTRPSGYLPSDKRSGIVERLSAIRSAYNLLLRNRYEDPKAGVRDIKNYAEDSSVTQNLEEPTARNVQLALIEAYKKLADRLIISYAYDICKSTGGQSPNKALRSLIKASSAERANGSRGPVRLGGMGDHLVDRLHRFYGLPEDSVIQLAGLEANKGELLTNSEIGEVRESVKRAERELASSLCPKPEAADNNSIKAPSSELSWYNNPWVVATLSVGAVVGVHHIVKRAKRVM